MDNPSELQMDDSELQTKDRNKGSGFLGGLLVGSLAGAVAMLLFVPQSGEKTRKQIQRAVILIPFSARYADRAF